MNEGPSKASKEMLAILTLLVYQGRYNMFQGVGRAGRRAATKRHAKNKVARVSRGVNRG